MASSPAVQECPACSAANRALAQFCAQCGAPLQLQNKYRIIKLLGRGAYGAVYEAQHLRLGGARFAIKELFPETNATPTQRQTASTQFNTEASILANLSHPMLPKVTDFFTERGRDYLVMEFVPGETLQEYLARITTPLPEAQVLKWADELCDALGYLHAQTPPVIHRDLKPSNIKITPDGKLKLLDFGIAKLLSVGSGTATAARAVSPPYAPLEQYGKGTDTRSDIYALGVVMYEMLTKVLPPDAPDRANQAVIPPRQHNAAISPRTETIVLKAMEEKQAKRFQTIGLLQSVLRDTGALADPNPALATPAAQVAAIPASLQAPPRQSNRQWLLGALLVIAVIAILIIFVWAQQMQTDADFWSSRAAILGATLAANQVARAQQAETIAASELVQTLQAMAIATGEAVQTQQAATITSSQVTQRQQAATIAASQSTQTRQAETFATIDAVASRQAEQIATHEAVASRQAETIRSILAMRQLINLKVDSEAEWQQSGLNVLTGERVTITYLAGTWSPCAPKHNHNCPFYDAAGVPESEEYSENILSGCPHAALIARIENGGPFCIKKGFSFRATEVGRVQFSINDVRHDDDDGIVEVRIQVTAIE